ncbi:hypothetical protein R70006_04993 [Paraburkholderia domus]|uniref:hypothetical protein n=1 Tax=Paraburkholderia domus TaxID=2793075 RepID=UPI001914AB1E|nr:hypothetical protein [Paraburkholderia domus]MBK5051770.1 hypothetical protein [Burkholderia sp. R-70006]CAE6794208.1 hypothetical protein R70006_04993 [Paraburkholderia domus]
MAGNEGSASAAVSAGAHTVLRVLEKKAYFKHRFLEQVLALYKASPNSELPTLPASLYLGGLFSRMPESARAKAGDIAARHVVDDFEACPTPVEIRAVIAEATLASMGLSFESLAERAKLFLACPPTDQAVASRWPEQVIYTTVQRIGRERFVSISPEEWRREISQTIFGEGEALKTYCIPVSSPLLKQKRDFRSLIANHE